MLAGVALYGFFLAPPDTLGRAAQQRRRHAPVRQQLAPGLRRPGLLRRPQHAPAAAPHLVALDRGAVLPRLAARRPRGAALVPVAPAAARPDRRRRGGQCGRHGRRLRQRRRREPGLLRHRHPGPGPADRRGAGHRARPPAPPPAVRAPSPPPRWSGRSRLGPAARVVLVVLGGVGTGRPCCGWPYSVDATSTWIYRGGFTLVALATAAVIASVALLPASPWGRFLSLRPVRYVGAISYGLYLYHWPIFVVLTHERTGLSGWALFALRVGCSVAVAAVSLHFLELPIRRGLLRQLAGLGGHPPRRRGDGGPGGRLHGRGDGGGQPGAEPGPDQVLRPPRARTRAPRPTCPPWPPAPAGRSGCCWSATPRPASWASGWGRTRRQVRRPLRGRRRVRLRPAHVHRPASTAPWSTATWATAAVTCPCRATPSWPAGRPTWTPSTRTSSCSPTASTRCGTSASAAAGSTSARPPSTTGSGRALTRATSVLGSTGATVVLLTAPYYQQVEQADGQAWPEDDPGPGRPLQRAAPPGGRQPSGGRVVVADLGAKLDPGGHFTTTIDGVDGAVRRRDPRDPGRGASWSRRGCSPGRPPLGHRRPGGGPGDRDHRDDAGRPAEPVSRSGRRRRHRRGGRSR